MGQGLPRNQVEVPPVKPRPTQEQMTADLLASGQPIQPVQPAQPGPVDNLLQGLGSGAKAVLEGFGDFVNKQKETPEGRLLLTNLLAGVTVGLGADPAIGANIVQQGQKQFELGVAREEKQADRQFQLDVLEAKEKAETKKAERKAVAEAKKAELKRIAESSKELRQTRNRFTQAGFSPITENDIDIPLDLKATYLNPVTGELENVINQKEATKRQVNVFQDGKKIKMYAYTADDAKEIKKATESKQKIDAITNELIRLRNKYGSETFPNKAKTDMKKYYRQLQLAFKDLNNLGVISDSDYKNFIEPSVPDPTRWARPGTVVQELEESIKFAENRLQDIYESRVYNYERPVKPITDDDEKDKKNTLLTDGLGNTLDGYTVRVKQ